jgi:hypothetical protein
MVMLKETRRRDWLEEYDEENEGSSGSWRQGRKEEAERWNKGDGMA